MLGNNRLAGTEFNETEHMLFFEFADAPELLGTKNGVLQEISESSLLQTYVKDGSVTGAILNVCQNTTDCLSTYYIRMMQGVPWNALVEYKGPKGESHFRDIALKTALEEVWVHRMFVNPQRFRFNGVNDQDLYPERTAWRKSKIAQYIVGKIDTSRYSRTSAT